MKNYMKPKPVELEKCSKSTCEICGAEIDLLSDGWREGDGAGDICADCVKAAEEDEDE